MGRALPMPAAKAGSPFATQRPMTASLLTQSEASAMNVSAGHGRAALRPLTTLRFLAALHVVLYHGFGGFPASQLLQERAWLTNFLKTGYISVSVFFILSG